MRAGETIRRLEAENDRLRDQVAALEGQLRALECEPVTMPAWSKGFSPQQAAFLGALYAAYPRALSYFDLDDALPRYDHVLDRDLRIVAQVAHHVRKKLPAGTIESVRPRRYRLTAIGKQYLDAGPDGGPA